MMDFTVAIPTYNGQSRLPEVLEKLRSQLNPNGLTWEILVVDNNSQDATAQVVQAFQTNFPVPIQYLREPRQGAGYARQTAVQQAQSDWVGFLDDDNLPEANWVSQAIQFAQAHPKAGAIASRVRGDFEVSPPQDLHRVLAFLAITDRGAKPLLYSPHSKLLPPSAGLVIRRQVWLDCVPQEGMLSRLKFKRSDGNDCGEDLEALAHIQRSNWEIWYDANLQITHKIPAWRLERSYLLPLFRSIGLSRHVTRMLSVQSWQQPWIFWAYLLNDGRKIVAHYFKYRSQLQTDLAAACEMQLFVGSLLSPFYLWWKKYWPV